MSFLLSSWVLQGFLSEVLSFMGHSRSEFTVMYRFFCRGVVVFRQMRTK